MGDQVLQVVGNRKQKVVGENGVATRIGADEFNVLLYNYQNEEEVREFIGKLKRFYQKGLLWLRTLAQ